ncbi:E3 ubiquitin-protein ligase complex SLX5-SLX8 subunit SLX8-like [Vigna umbellata]|uniref:E3 ubiquitin-protein ligase complex SLX5-SLX8 subunit SLX8-like n=1 Tax=Vigna umbellata TaxID=87088 RepID=UPI001F5E4927|nr:E3 ubiquitin-protein ligase complex SLX5-SLX8 subunit SLX8-like isoform X1 [Vigna umbellata]XP_047151591.1 E3 ubiquitin-protein ligase complex SLX5-SLX8 subunit SLX8-like isoform X2 [Vigna umbellata]XP_047151592.1 E3 ubiquitin-protein ligase complex SLX5-SLX8 subunit SLX8-like [Vigna umbellata]
MEGRRRITLYDQMTASNDNTNSGSSSRDSLASLMLEDVVFKKAEAEADAEASRDLSRSRTLQDIIREEKPNEDAKDRNSWKAFKEKLRLKRAIGLAWSSAPTHSNNSNNNDNEDGSLPQTRLLSDDAATQQNDVVVEDANDSDPIARFGSPTDNTAAGGDSSDGENNQEVAVGVSLMDLLEEAEQEMDLYRVSDDDVVADFEKRDEDEAEDEEKEGLVEYNCCVCMVRHKGAAFIPCGHTFCRMCCREIWASRGNCPLCNNLILEILDIF